MAGLASFRTMVYGHVQGVFFRDFTVIHAISLGLTGYVRNLPGGRVLEVAAEGELEKLERLVDYLKVGPSGAQVEGVETNWTEYTANFSNFSVRR